MALTREDENDAFRTFIRNRDNELIDEMVMGINSSIEPLIDCTKCGGCCKGLMINITEDEITTAAEHLRMPEKTFKHKFVEEGISGKMIMNTIPCHFLSEDKCTIYEFRFNECREFPHLHKPNFSDRLFGTLIHYSMCPIIYNVIEMLKIKSGFKGAEIG